MTRPLLLLAGLLPLLIPPSCMDRRALHAVPAGTLRTHYIVDYDYRNDPARLHATMGHLLVFNPGDPVATLTITLYFEDHEPQVLRRDARGRATTEFNAASLGVPQNRRFALRVESSQPVICQATEGWTNTGNEYDTTAATHSPRGPRETARSTMALDRLATRWFVADGFTMNTRGGHWIRESEWALVLNPGDAPAAVDMRLSLRAGARTESLVVPPRRLRAVPLDPLVPPNQHYGAEFLSDRPVAVQWRREVYWSDSDELMAFWSVPGVPLSEPGLAGMPESAR